MGVVFKALEHGLGRVVAVKMFLPGALPGEAEVQRFQTEAAAAARVKHPHIVAVHRVGTHDGRPFYSMDFIDGLSLTQRLADGPLPSRTAARYIATIARAIHHAHQHGILHRDLKPGNILLDAADQPHVTDFGLAKHYTADAGQTRTGAVLGTPGYMAPEQASGRKDLGPACDVYALGALLYELLTARPPFRAETPLDTLLQVLERDPAPPRLVNPKVDCDLETICLKCLCKSPRDRYASAEQLADDLERYLHGDSIHARSFNMIDRLSRALGRSHYDVEFRAYGALLYWFALIVGVTHVVKYFAMASRQSGFVVIGVQMVQFLAMGLLLWWQRPRGLLPTTAAERQLWSVWISYLVGCFLMAFINKELFGWDRLYEGVDYPFFAVTAGMAFFVLGSSYWGWLYAFGLAFFALSGVMLLHLSWAPLEYGALWSAALVTLGTRLYRLGGDTSRDSKPS
jgi:hypothetical protein